VGARPLGAASAVYGAAPWAFSAADAWKAASPIHMGIMHLRYEGSFSLPVPQVRSPYTSTNRRLFFVKHWRNQQRVRCGLDGRFPAACAKMLACPSTTPRSQQQQAKRRRDARLGEHHPGSDEGTFWSGYRKYSRNIHWALMSRTTLIRPHTQSSLSSKWRA
jgi:hypothetical protein